MDYINLISQFDYQTYSLEDSPVGFMPFVVAATFAVATTYYIFSVAKKPKIYTSNANMLQFLENHVPSIQEVYFPNYLVWEGRLQSIFGLSLRLPDSYSIPYTREVIKLKDGGEIGLDLAGLEYLQPTPSTDKANKDPLVVFLLPGLTSSSQTCYVKTLVLSIVSTGSIVAVLNNRGLGGVPVKTPRLYSASNYEDVQEVIHYLRDKFPNFRKMAVGTSMGAMIMSKYLINRAEEAKNIFSAVLCVSSLWDAGSGVESLENWGINKHIINREITQNLIDVASKYRDVLEVRECFDFKKIMECQSIREFDTHFTAPQFGFKSAEDYYGDASVSDSISKFSVPVFALNAEDDPFSPDESLPREQAQAPGSNFCLITTSRGGHLGYLEGYLPTRRREHYMERVVADFCRAVKDHHSELL